MVWACFVMGLAIVALAVVAIIGWEKYHEMRYLHDWKCRLYGYDPKTGQPLEDPWKRPF